MNPSPSSQSIDLPASVTTKDGATFDPRSSVWSYRDATRPINLNFESLRATPDMVRSVKQVLIWYAQNHSPYSLDNIFNYLKRMLTFISRTEQSPVGEITAIHVLNFRTSLRERDFYILGTLRGFFKQLHGFRLVGVTVDAIKLLNEMRIPGNIKGEAVRTLDPKNGPYTDIELYAIHSALDQAYQDSVIDIREFLLAWVSIALAPRPIQFATMKVCDVSYTSTDDGTVSYFLQVPRAKQRYARAREEFHPRIIVPRVGQLLLEYAKSVEHQFAGILPNPHMAPLFPSTEGRLDPADFPQARRIFGTRWPANTCDSNSQSASTGDESGRGRTTRPRHSRFNGPPRYSKHH
jgi:hypothetical protein